MSGMGGGSGQADKITLEDCVFKSIVELGATSSRIRTNTGSDYQKNADNYYYQVLSLWALVSDYMDDSAINARRKTLQDARLAYASLSRGKSYISKDKQDEVVNLTFMAANKLFETICSCLAQKGLLRERSAGAIAGDGQTMDISEEELDEDEKILDATIAEEDV